LLLPATAQRPPDLRPALLEIADLPSGWLIAEVDASDVDALSLASALGFDLARLGVDPNGPCTRLAADFAGPLQSQPVTQAVSAFERGDLGPVLTHSVALLPAGEADRYLALSEASAFQSFFDTCVPEILRAEGDEYSLNLGGLFGEDDITFQASPFPVPSLADQVTGARIDTTFGVTGTSILIASIRRGNLVSTITLQTNPFAANESSSVIDGLLRRADQKLTGILVER